MAPAGRLLGRGGGERGGGKKGGRIGGSEGARERVVKHTSRRASNAVLAAATSAPRATSSASILPWSAALCACSRALRRHPLVTPEQDPHVSLCYELAVALSPCLSLCPACTQHSHFRAIPRPMLPCLPLLGSPRLLVCCAPVRLRLVCGGASEGAGARCGGNGCCAQATYQQVAAGRQL
jgi:hypothetical protein